MGIFLVGRAIEDVRAHLFRKRITILYPVSRENSYLSTDPFWEENKEIFSFRFRFRRSHFLILMDAMDLTGKIFRCFSVKSDYRHSHIFPADLCIMVVLHRLAYPCRFWQLVNIFSLPSNRIAEMYHTAIDYLYFKYKHTIDFGKWRSCFGQFADLLHEYGSPYEHYIG